MNSILPYGSTEKKLLRASEFRYCRLFETAQDGILILDAETGMVVDVNPFLVKLLGYSHDVFLGKKVWELGFFKDLLANEVNFRELQAKAYVRYEDLPLETADGRRIEVEFVSNVYLVDEHRVIQCNICDISIRKLAKKRTELARDILAILNRPNDIGHIIRDMLRLLKQETDIEAVGIRLKEGEDFPYAQTMGFSDHFLQLGNQLCTRNATRDAQGKLVLECMCGNVLCGRTDTTRPYFTAAGSFWTNSITDFPASATEAERQASIRTCCKDEGHESVALIPLRSGDEIIGLLQLNDHRRNQFTLDRVTFLEGIGASIGIALTRLRADEKLRVSETKFRTLYGAMNEGLALHELVCDASGKPVDYVLLDANPAFETHTGLDRAAVIGRKASEIYGGAAPYLETYATVAVTGRPVSFETTYAPMKKTFSISVFSPAQGRFATVFADITEHSQTAERIRNMAERFQTIINQQHYGLLVVNRESRVEYANQVFCNLLGLREKPDELCGLTDVKILQIIRPAYADPDDVFARIKDLLARNAPSFDNEVIMRNGQTLLLDFVPLMVEGQNTGRMWLHRDISERKRMELMLRANETKFRTLVENIPQKIFLKDRDSRFISVNVNFARDLGLRPEALIGKSDYDFSPKELAEQYRADDQRVMQTGQTEEVDEKYIQNNCETWVHTIKTPVRDDAGGITGVLGIFWDITARKLAEAREQLARAVLELLNRSDKAEATIRGILDLIKQTTGFEAVGIRLRQGDDYPYFVQQGFSSDFLLTENTLLAHDAQGGICKNKDGSPCLECTCGLTLSGRIDPTNPFFTPGGSFWTNNSVPLLDLPPEQDPRLHPRNRCIHAGFLSVALIPLRAGQDIIGLLQLNDHRPNQFTLEIIQFFEGLSHSIGIALNRMQAVQQQNKLEHQLRQAAKMEAIGLLAGGVAHDFNNKLQIILGYAEMLLKASPDKQSIRAGLQEIQAAANYSADLTRQLLTFSRKQAIAPVVLDLNAAIAASVKMLRRLVGENIQLNFAAVLEPRYVFLDPGQLDQLLANLTINARDAIAEVGSITITVTNQTLCVADCRDKSDFVAPGDYVVLKVSDDGAGMPREIQAHIFEPFFTTKEVGKGTGLGLATVYGIIKQNHGAITVQSVPGQGTTFTIYLPGVKAATLAVGEPQAAPRPTGKETILVVEDEESVLKLVELTLTQQGYHVLTASTPHLAVQMCERHPESIHLLLTDVIMPELSGKDLAKRVQKLRPTMRILFMSGYTEDVMKGYLPESLHVLQKPFTAATLLQRVRAALDCPPPIQYCH